jgi:hypothetical protein
MKPKKWDGSNSILVVLMIRPNSEAAKKRERMVETTIITSSGR